MKRREFLVNAGLATGGLKLSKYYFAHDRNVHSPKKSDSMETLSEQQASISYSCASLPEGYFELLPQEAVRYSKFPVSTKHNAIWDFGWGHDGRMYASLCGELGNALNAILFEYDRATGKLEFCFDTGRETMADPRMIPPSKIHTSITPIREGKVLMTTHTTARSKVHPYWMFDQHYTHQWEGFPGSHVLVWDPSTRQCANLGIPVARDSIYGASYDDRNNALWFSTYLKGHLHRLDLESRKVQDFGQITEFGSYKFVRDRLGNMLISTRSGTVFHISVDDCRITDLGVLAKEPEKNPLWKGHRILAHDTRMPDGRSLVGLHWSDFLYAFDPENLKFERLGDFRPAEFIQSGPLMMQKGLAFDSDGILWQTTLCPLNQSVGFIAHLFRWDIMKGREPEYVGLLGIPDRVTSCVSEMHMDNNDVLHIADSNHGDDMPGIIAVNTRLLKRNENTGKFLRSERVHDVTAYLPFSDGREAYPSDDFDKAAAPYLALNKEYDEYGRFLKEKAQSGIRAAKSSGIRLWRQFGRGDESLVQNMEWSDRNNLVFQLPSGSYIARANDNFQAPQPINHIFNPDVKEKNRPKILDDAIPPSRQGRQYRSVISAWVKWNADSWLIGTDDGCVALFNEKTKQTYGLGAIGAHGPVHQIAVANGHAYGVSGDPSDLGNLFHFSDRTGLREAGRLFFIPSDDPVFSNSRPVRVALSPDATMVAVSVADELGCIYIYESVNVL
jgi:hypothetical protein